MIKEKIKKLDLSATLKINELSKNLSLTGKDIIKFGFGQSPFKIPKIIVEELKKNADQKSYLPIQGLLELRKSVSKYLMKRTGNKYSEKNILITPGSKEAMLLMHVAFKGHIILPAPSWVSYEPQAKIAKNNVHWIESSRENNWFPTSKELEKKIKMIGKKNILLILNSPNNPSGTTCENLKDLAKVSKKYKLLVLSDEIYTDLSFNNSYESISKYYPEGTFVSGGLSKWCGAGGWRLGFFAASSQLSGFIEHLKTLACESYSTVNTPTQFAAVEAYNGNYVYYIKNTTKILNSVGNYVYSKLKSNKVLVNPPQGGFYLMPEFINKKYKSSSSLCEAILNETGVAMLPASEFGFNSKRMLTRLSYTDFDGGNFLKNISDIKTIDEEILQKYAPNVVEGVKRLTNWAKNL